MKILSVIFIFLNTWIFSQNEVALLFEEMPNDSLQSYSIQSHSSVQPAIRWTRNDNGLIKFGTKSKAYTGITLNPLLDLNYRYFDKNQYRTGGGLNFESNFENKWYFRANAIAGVGSGDSSFISNAYIVQADTSNYSYLDLRGRLSYTPNKIFNFQAGLDHNFIGEGNRSLFLSDYGKAHPFGQIRAVFWRVEYTVLYQFFKEETSNGWKQKNGATHHISFNAAKWLNFGIFESVIFLPKDTMLNRGYDVEYLNPVIFYRPQEYALGSSDNVVLGVSFNAKYKNHMMYGQFILDEFLLSEIKAKTKSWTNKYGTQLGIKGRFEFGKNRFFYRTEYNFVRPFTYAHLNSGQNYGNQGMTLSHPLGSNFMEILFELKIQNKRWALKTFFSYFLKGYDKDGFSYGGNIYQPYTLRPYDYGNFTGQGKGNNGFRGIITLNYQVMKTGNLQAFFENQIRYDSAFNKTSYIPTIGLRSQLWNDYRNY